MYHKLSCGALTEKVNVDEVWEALSDENKHVVVQPAPAVRAALGEEFGYESEQMLQVKWLLQ